MYPHRIRLRGPWQWETDTQSGTITMPGTLPVSGPVRLRRRFGWPGRIDSHERVWLICAGIDAKTKVILNGQLLCSEAAVPFEYEVTALRQPRNELQLETDAQNIAEVSLEVRCTAWLRNVQVSGNRIHGEVIGVCDRPLDLYVLGESTRLAYASVTAGSAFDLSLDPDAAIVRVELVNGGVVWYTIALRAP
jgi:hypothetical protein